MATDPDAIEQAVARTLRDNLERIQRTSDELHRAVNDLVSACASSRPSNALPPMVRAQASAASLSAVLDVLSRFVTAALQPGMRSAEEQEMLRAVSAVSEIAAHQTSVPVDVPVAHTTEASNVPVDMAVEVQAEEPVTEEPVAEVPEIAYEVPLPALSQIAPEFAGENLGAVPSEVIGEVPEQVPEQVLETDAPEVIDATLAPVPEPSQAEDVSSNSESATFQDSVPASEAAIGAVHAEGESSGDHENEPSESAPPVSEIVVAFNMADLPIDQQELHRRAYRVAKVSMQDIKMLRPEDVRLGRENRDLCFRLRDDIEKAHKEYERRFQPILSHPVDYFYDWMVEVLGGGNAEALGEYPYPSAVMHH